MDSGSCPAGLAPVDAVSLQVPARLAACAACGDSARIYPYLLKTETTFGDTGHPDMSSLPRDLRSCREGPDGVRWRQTIYHRRCRSYDARVHGRRRKKKGILLVARARRCGRVHQVHHVRRCKTWNTGITGDNNRPKTARSPGFGWVWPGWLGGSIDKRTGDQQRRGARVPDSQNFPRGLIRLSQISVQSVDDDLPAMQCVWHRRSCCMGTMG